MADSAQTGFQWEMMVPESSREFPLQVKALDRFESVFLSLPFIFFGFCLLPLFLGRALNPDETRLVIFSRYYIFMGTSHILFTLITLSCLPEARNLVRDSWIRSPRWIFISLFLLVLVPGAKWIEANWQISPRTQMLLFLFPTYLFARHSISQTLGLSVIYNRRAEPGLNESELRKMRRAERKERRLSKVIVFLIVTQILGSYILPREDSRFHVQAVLGVMSFVVCVTLFFNVFRDYSGPVWRNKRIFLCRIFIYPLTLVTPLAFSCISALHGSEYFLFSTNLVRRSRSTRAALIAGSLPFIALLAVLPMLPYKTPEIARSIFGFGPHKSWTCLFYFFITVEYLHYFLDGVLFRAKDPLIREHIRHLLIGSAS